jgi:hypothetical protein
MNGMPDWEPTLDDVAREYPDWRPYRGVNGLCYASAPGGGHVMGEDPLDLRDQIRGWLGRHEEWRPGGALSAADRSASADEAGAG